MKTIISVSRRTDIPAYYAEWFKKRLEFGYTVYPNPMSTKPVIQSLVPDNVLAFVFWTRNPKPFFKYLDYIDAKYGKIHYMHFSINGLPEEIELRNPKIDFAIDSAKYLSDRYGENYVQWRFDPIVLSSLTTEKYIFDKFEYIAKRMEGVVKRCYFSFVDYYQKTQKNIDIVSKEHNIIFKKPTIEEQIKITEKLVSIANAYKIALYACAEDNLLSIAGVSKAHCVDMDLINNLEGVKKIIKSIKPSRIGCGCYDSRDIGYYDSCPHGCIYCYSNLNPQLAYDNSKRYIKEGFPLDNVQKVQTESNNLFNIIE